MRMGDSPLDRIEPVILPEAPIGLLSDAHGDTPMALQGVERLVEAGAGSLLYLGDVCGEGVIDALAGVTGAEGGPIPARLVFGNMDFDTGPMTRYARSIGVGVDHPCGLYRCGSVRLVATHGHLHGYEEAAITAGIRYFLHGHTHKVRDERRAGTRVCNPGALHRARRLTVAILDTSLDEFRTIQVG